MSERLDNHGVATAPPRGASTNSALKDRVQSLRLGGDGRRGGRAAGNNMPWVLCGVFLLSTVAFGVQAFAVRGREPAEAPPPNLTPPTAAKTAVTTEPEKSAETVPGKVLLESRGYVIPIHQIQVSPKVSGMVTKLNIREGMDVQQGAVLAELEKVEYEADVQRAEAALKMATWRLNELKTGNREEEKKQTEAELAQAEAELKQLKLDWQRTSRLSGAQALAAREYEQAASAYQAQERKVQRLRYAHQLMLLGPRVERIKLAEAELEQARADLTKAKWRLDNCTILAPVTGTILSKKTEEGNIVNPAAFNISASLCEMADLSELEVELSIQERDIANVFPQQRCRVIPEAFQNNKVFLKDHPEGFQGVVSRLMPIADRAKGAIPVRVKLDREQLLAERKKHGGMFSPRPDMSAVVSFLAGDK